MRFRKKKIIVKKHCFLCYNFTLFQFSEEQVKLCAENWLYAEKCLNYNSVKVYYNGRTIIIKEG